MAMISSENYDKILVAKREAAEVWPSELTLNEETFEVRYSYHADGKLDSFVLIDGTGGEIFPCHYDSEQRIELIEVDILNLISYRYRELFWEGGMDDRLASLFARVRFRHVRDNYESWSRKDRAGLLENRLKHAVAPEEIDRILGKPEGYTLALEDFSSNPRVSELIDYHAAISTALLFREDRNNG